MVQPVNCFNIETASTQIISVSIFEQLDYQLAQQSMSSFAEQRSLNDNDQIWLLQHPPVYTQGTACQQQPLVLSDITVVKSDRGGQITYHAPGQVIMYVMLNLKRYGLGVKSLVTKLEEAVIVLLDELGVTAERRIDAPGVYVSGAKIAALGLRIKRGNSYHGLSFNVDMDLAPFSNIDPCGHQGLEVTQLANYIESPDLKVFERRLLECFVQQI